MNNALSLTDGVELNQISPLTFRIPSNDRKAALQRGDEVKLGFISADNRHPIERMWVVITDISPDGTKFVGRLNNQPIKISDYILCGEMVEFESKHILAI